jgi:hypothetical protein
VLFALLLVFSFLQFRYYVKRVEETR